MSIYFSTNLPEMQAMLTFNRLSLDIARLTKRLETGQRINSSKDDPSGLIARDGMRAGIKGIQNALTNTNRANSMLSTAESGMANISRILVGDPTDPSNNGLIGLIYDDNTPSSLKKAQINDILNMINSVARSTTYNGKQLLDGSLDYRTNGVDSKQISRLAISKAEIPPGGQPVSIKILEDGKKGTLTLNQAQIGGQDVTLQIQGGNGQATSLTFTAGMTAEQITNLVNQNTDRSGVTARTEEGLTNNQFLASSLGDDNDVVFTVKGGVTGDYSVAIGEIAGMDPSKIAVSWSGSTFVINYGVDLSSNSPTAADLLDKLKTGTNIIEGATGDLDTFRNTFDVELAAGEAGTGQISDSWKMVTSGNALNGNGLQFTGGNGAAQKIEIVGRGILSAPLDIQLTGDTLVIQLATDAQGNVITTAQELVEFMNGKSAADTGGIGTAVLRPDGQSYTDKSTATANFGYGIVSPTSGTVDLAVMGGAGYRTVNATDKGATKIIFETVKDGSKQAVQVKDLSGQLLITNKNGHAATTDSGKDMVAKVNGYDAVSDGRILSFTSESLSFTAEIGNSVKKGDTVRFNIIGGGATFQLGKDVRSEMQLHVGIPSVDTLHLGGNTGFLDELRDIDFDTDAGKQKAYKIVNEAVGQIATFRAFLGSVQKSTLDTNAVHLDSQLESVTASEAEISNADMALESSQLTRAELLAQAAMQSILYSRSYAQYIVNSLF